MRVLNSTQLKPRWTQNTWMITYSRRYRALRESEQDESYTYIIAAAATSVWHTYCSFDLALPDGRQPSDSITVFYSLLLLLFCCWCYYCLLYFGRTCSRHVIHSLIERNIMTLITPPPPPRRSRLIVYLNLFFFLYSFFLFEANRSYWFN